MRMLFSTDRIAVGKRYRTWREVAQERMIPTEASKLGDGVFDARLEAADVGGLLLTRSTFGAMRVESTAATIRRHTKQDTLGVTLRLSGQARVGQHGRAAIQQPGDFVVLDNNAPLSLAFPEPSGSLLIELPRERLERMLGSARLYAALTIEGSAPGSVLARTFFTELIRVHARLSPDMAERMTTVGVDLLVACVAERLARETPRSLQGTVLVQRAKAHAAANLADPGLDPPKLAAALGVSLRRLQELFHERGQHVSEWIWGQRLEAAARHLANPAQQHVSIGALAYGCGFVSQAHFARRFKSRYGLTPTEYRQRSR